MQESKSGAPIVNKKNIFSQFVYQTNNKLKRGFKSGSFVEVSDEPDEGKKDMSIQTNFRSETHINETKKVEICRESFTQTSKTILTLVQEMESGNLSPDSLSPKRESPKKEIYAEEYWVDSEEGFAQSVSEKQLDNLSFNRKTNVEQYLDYTEATKRENFLTGNSLTKTFLEQKRNKAKSPMNQVQKLFQPKTALQQDGKTLRSQSYVEPPRSRVTSPSTVSANQEPRFKVKNITEKSPEDKTKPVRYFCQGYVPTKASNESEITQARSRRSMSFMSPTISSGNKDQSKEIKCLEKLISPTRRGRSASPKKNITEEPKVMKKVPYIDKHEECIEPVSKMTTIPYVDKVMSDILEAPPCTEANEDSTRNVPKYEEDGGSQMCLDLRLSCEDLTNSTVVGSVTSVTSTESILFQALGKLRDQDWSIALRGLAEVVEMCRVLDADFAFPHMTLINQRLIELMRSPRSHVCRTSCQAVGHLFEYVKDTRRPEFDELVDTLLCRTADANKFIRHDANLALDCMVTHIPTFHAIRSLTTKGPDHKNPLVRMATARLIVCAVVIAGPQTILHPNGNESTRKRIILDMVKFLEDKDIGTRKFGERLYRLFYKDRIFDIYLKRYLEKDMVTKIKKCLRCCNGEK